MARIKCRYRAHKCPYGEVWHGCWDKYDADCSYFIAADTKCNIMNPPCGHILTHNREFEKTYKTYELEIGDDYGIWAEGYLKVGQIFIDQSDFDYLEIDGRTIIKEGKAC